MDPCIALMRLSSIGQDRGLRFLRTRRTIGDRVPTLPLGNGLLTNAIALYQRTQTANHSFFLGSRRAWIAQIALRKTALARGRATRAKARSKAGHTVIDTQVGHDVSLSATRIIGTVMLPTTRIVSHGAASSERICPYRSRQTAQ